MCLQIAYINFINDKVTYAAPDTVRYYKDAVSGFLTWLNNSGIVDSMQLSQDLLKSYLIYLRHVRKIKNTSIHTYFRGIRNFCSYCIEQQYCCYFNYKIRLPRPDPDLVLPLSSLEAEKIFNYIDNCLIPETRPSYRLIVLLMLDMGLRRSEVLNLRRCDVDFDKKIIKIVDSKFNKSRILPIPGLILAHLQSLPFPEFPHYHYIRLSDSGLESFFARMKKSTGIQRLHPHLLRHTFATAYMLQRGNLEYLRMYLGHSSYDVTKRYIHISSELMICGYDCYKIDPVFK